MILFGIILFLIFVTVVLSVCHGRGRAYIWWRDGIDGGGACCGEIDGCDFGDGCSRGGDGGGRMVITMVVVKRWRW